MKAPTILSLAKWTFFCAQNMKHPETQLHQKFILFVRIQKKTLTNCTEVNQADLLISDAAAGTFWGAEGAVRTAAGSGWGVWTLTLGSSQALTLGHGQRWDRAHLVLPWRKQRGLQAAEGKPLPGKKSPNCNLLPWTRLRKPSRCGREQRDPSIAAGGWRRPWSRSCRASRCTQSEVKRTPAGLLLTRALCKVWISPFHLDTFILSRIECLKLNMFSSAVSVSELGTSIYIQPIVFRCSVQIFIKKKIIIISWCLLVLCYK